VWFESPQRIHAALADLEAVDAQRRCFVLREYTKMHEQQLVTNYGEAGQGSILRPGLCLPSEPMITGDPHP